MNKIIVLVIMLMVCQTTNGGEIVFLKPSTNTTSLYLESMLSLMGGISHDADEIDQFGFDVENGIENYAIGLRIGTGHYFNNFGVYCYGDYTKFFPGFFFYQRNPYSPALLRFNTNMLGYGLEVRTLVALRLKAGYGVYNGNIEVGSEVSDTEESWFTNISRGSGFHWSVGLVGELKKNLMATWEFTHYDCTITPEETQTPAFIEDINLSQWNLSLSLLYNFVAF